MFLVNDKKIKFSCSNSNYWINDEGYYRSALLLLGGNRGVYLLIELREVLIISNSINLSLYLTRVLQIGDYLKAGVKFACKFQVV